MDASNDAATKSAGKRKNRDPVARACSECGRKKVRCSGGLPCTGCVKNKIECIYTEPQRRGPKAKKHLSHQQQQQEQQQSSQPSQPELPSLHGLSPRRSLPPFYSMSSSMVAGLSMPLAPSDTIIPVPPPALTLPRSSPIVGQPNLPSMQLDPPMTMNAAADLLMAAQHTQELEKCGDPAGAHSPSTKPSEDSSFAERLYSTETPFLQGFNKILPHQMQEPLQPVAEGSGTSNIALVSRALEPDLRRLTELADQQSTQTLLYSIYWCFVHPLWPLLYRPAFDMHAVAIKHPLLHYAVLAISSRYDLDRQSEGVPGLFASLGFERSIHTHLGDLYFERAKQHYNPYDTSPSIETIQGLLLLAIREVAQGRGRSSYALGGMASRAVFNLSLHQAHSDKAENGNVSQTQSEARAVWSCYILDKYLALTLGKPHSIRYLDIVSFSLKMPKCLFKRKQDIPFPSQYESDEFSLWESDAKVLIPQAACKFAGIKTRAMSHLFAWIKLFSILERILDNIGAFRKLGANQRLTELATLDSALETWYKQHSDSASFTNPPTPLPNHLYATRLWYLVSLIILHRPFIPLFRAFPREQGVKSSYQICIEAALQVNTIVQMLDELVGLYRLSHYVVFVIFQAGIMHLAAAASSSEDEAARGRVLLHQCIAWLDQIGGTYAMSPPYQAVLRGLYQMGQKELRSTHHVNEILASRRGSRASSPVPDFMFEIAGQPGGSTPLPSGQLVDFNLLQNFLSDVPFTLPLSSDDILWNNFTSEYSDLFVDPTAQPTDML